MKNIYIASDHSGINHKKELIQFLQKAGFKTNDLGTKTTESVDYSDFGHNVATNVASDKNSFGIVICGSGNGITMTANKHQKIRAALCWIPEIATLAKQHNNANIIGIPARFTTEKEAIEIIKAYIKAEFEGGRHQKRIDKIAIK